MTKPNPAPGNGSAGSLAAAALQALLLMLALMMVALWTGTPPHPPASKGPIIAAIASLSWLALQLVRTGHPRAWLGVALAVLAGVPAFGPHKFWTEPEAVLLAPVIVLGSAVLVVLAGCAWRLREAERQVGSASLAQAPRRHRG